MTYTILASDPDQQLLGVATASRSLAVGAGVPAVRVGIGAVASQAYTNRALRGYALDRLADGAAPEEALADLPRVDSGAARRQIALLDASGRVALHTGAECSDWAGERSGRGFAVIGNLLAGPETLASMEAAFAASPAPPGIAGFARRLHRALAAGEAAGGDRRGRQSAAILVGAGPAHPREETALAIDLRVDDHADPVEELGRILDKALAG